MLWGGDHAGSSVPRARCIGCLSLVESPGAAGIFGAA